MAQYRRTLPAQPRAVIFANGELDASVFASRVLQPGDTLIAADGGLRHLRRLGLNPDQIVGDLDSISEQDLTQLQLEGCFIERHPTDKDATDLELALKWALENGFTIIRVAAALGGRLDQTLANVMLLTDPAHAELDLRLDDGWEEVSVIRSQAIIEGTLGDRVSLLALGGLAEGVQTESLRYPLREENLYPAQTRGISNLMLADRARVQIRSGQLLCIHTREGAAKIPR